MNPQELEKLVELVTAQVRTRLEQGGSRLPIPPVKQSCVGRTDPCFATKEQCEGSGMCAVRKKGVVEQLLADGASRIGAGPGIVGVDSALARMIDHTMLKADATREQLASLCKEARQYGFATVCVNSANIPYVAQQLSGSSVKPIAVVGFPLGASLPAAKAFEAREAVRNGAQEIDMVINVGALKSRDYSLVLEDIMRVVEASKPHKVKVILETGMLSDEEKVIACTLSKAGGAHFVKTSTGFGPGGATVQDIQLMRRVVGKDMEVKASGGIRTKEDAEAMRAAGADRIGASASVAIVTGTAKADPTKKGY